MKKTSITISVLSAIVILCIIGILLGKKADIRDTINDGSLQAYYSYTIKHAKGRFAEEARDSVNQKCNRIIGNLESENTIVGWNRLSELIPEPLYRDEYAQMVESKLAALYEIEYDKALKKRTIEGWEEYKSIVPQSNWKYPDDHIEALKKEQEEAKWKSEPTAWRAACDGGRISDYEKYLKFHPYGTHAKQAEKMVIDLDVEAVFSNEHGTLPPMDKSYGGGSTSHIEIHNSTSYTITISYSGPSSKRISISPGATCNVSLSNGNYRVAARAVGGGVQPFAGTENLDGGMYEVTYYIRTYRY